MAGIRMDTGTERVVADDRAAADERAASERTAIAFLALVCAGAL